MKLCTCNVFVISTSSDQWKLNPELFESHTHGKIIIIIIDIGFINVVCL